MREEELNSEVLKEIRDFMIENELTLDDIKHLVEQRKKMLAEFFRQANEYYGYGQPNCS